MYESWPSAWPFLHYAFAKTLSEMLPAEEADLLTRMAIEEYGRLAAWSPSRSIWRSRENL